MQLASGDEVTRQAEVAELRHRPRYLIRDDRYQAVRPQRHRRQRRGVVTREDRKALWSHLHHPAHLHNVARRLLHPLDPWDRRQASQGGRGHVDAGAARNVVDDDREIGGLGKCAVVREEPVWSGFVVEGCHHQEAVGPNCLDLARQIDHLGRVAPPTPSNHRHAPVGRLDNQLGNPDLLGARERRALPGGTARYQEVHPRVDLPTGKRHDTLLVNHAVAQEGGHEGRAAPTQRRYFAA